MTTTSTASAGTRRDLIGRGLLAFAAIANVGAFTNGIVIMSNAADRLWVESWRTTAFLVFAALLVWAPQA